MEILKPQLLSSNTPYLHTRLTEFLPTPLPVLPFLLYGGGNSLINVTEGLLGISVNVDGAAMLLLFRYFIYIYSCSICSCIFLFTCLQF